MSKPILCLDFDGVIHAYTTPWIAADVIPDPPVPGALEFIDKARHHFEIAIFSSRSHQQKGIEAMQVWLAFHYALSLWKLDLGSHPEDAGRSMEPMRAFAYVTNAILWPTEKPPAFVTLDDRALTFSGKWPDPEGLLTFKTWNKP